MANRLVIGYPRHLVLVVALVIACAGMVPLTAQAGAPGAPPPAVQLSLSLLAQTPQGSVSVSGTGVANRTGDARLSLTISAPEEHTIDFIRVDGTTYVSMDGEAYTSSSDSTGLPPDCMPSVGTAGMLNPQTLLGSGSSVQHLGTEMLDGVTVEHVAVHGDLGAFLTQIFALIQQTAVGCGVSSSATTAGIDLSGPEAQQALAGSTFDVDLYLEPPTEFPRRLVVTIDMPGISTTMRLQVDSTPLAAPVPIAAPE